jgi:hypothetical protein
MRVLFCLNDDIWSYIVYRSLAIKYDNHNILLSKSSFVLDKELTKIENFLDNKIQPNWYLNPYVEDINTQYYKNFAKDYDIIVSVRFLKIFDDEFCTIPKHGIINVHSGLLPFYRGVVTTFWAMLNQEKEHGYTIHYVDNKKIDRGRIIGNYIINGNNINYNSMVNILHHKYHDISEKMLSLLEKIQDNHTIQTKESDKGHYYSKPSNEDIVKFKNLGLDFCTNNDYSLF